MSAGSVLVALLLLAAPARASAEEPEPKAEAPEAKPAEKAEQPAKGGEKAEDPEEEAKKLAQASQNPIASLISVPFQFNMSGGLGPNQRTQFVLNIQPVIPIKLAHSVSFIARLITPFVGQPDASGTSDTSGTSDASGTTGSTWGLGDFNPQLYIAVELKHGFTVGAGPTLVIPTATDSSLGSGKLSIGPAAVGVWTGKHLVIGALVNNVWSVAGDASRPAVNQFFTQPFINLNLPHKTFLVTAPQIVGDWKNGNWVVPVGGGAGAILKIGLPTNVNLQAYWNAVSPANGPKWVVRLQFSFLFPAGKE